jgi:hypothetical protein
MPSGPPVHEFDPDRARHYLPKPTHVKTAILVDVPDDAITSISAPFGPQQLRGPFYVVAEGSRSYGAAKAQFEAAHRSLGDHRWVKTRPVLAYRAGSDCTVRTEVDGHAESVVVATATDWIVRQATGEVMVVGQEDFEERYEPVE